MPYNITLSNGTDLIAGGLLDNTTDSVNSSLTLVGKNYKSYGLFLNQNFVRLMENFALSTAPTAPVSGQLWFNSTSKLLSVNVAATKGTVNAIWKTIAGMTLSATTPNNAYTGELWYNTTEGQLKIYTGTEWRLIGPLSKIATGNSGAIPDTVTDAPPSTTYVVIKFFIDNVLVGIWSDDGPFASDVAGFATIKKGINLNSTLGHKFWGNSEVSDSLYVSGVPVAGTSFLRNDISGTVNGSLSLTNDGGITFGAASDFVGSVSSGIVTLRNQTNDRDLILSLKRGGVQTPFLRGNATTGLTEAYAQPTASAPALTLATKNYVDILSGSVNGSANFFGDVTPNANVTYTLGNTTNRWDNIFSENILVGNITAANTFATISNIAQIYLGADMIPTANISSNIGSSGTRLNTLHANSVSLTGSLNVGLSTLIGANLTVTGTALLSANTAITGNLNISSSRTSTSTTTGALVLSGGAGIAGNLSVGGIVTTLTMPTGTSNTAVATTAFVTAVTGSLGNLSIQNNNNVTITGGTMSGMTSVADSVGNLRNLPVQSKGSSYSLLVSDSGQVISITSGGVTLNSGVFSAGQSVTIYNNSSSSQTITQGTSVTMRQVVTGLTGNRTLAGYGLCTILCIASNQFVITGAGLT